MRALSKACLAVLLVAGCTSFMSEPPRTITSFKATLSGANETPPNASEAGGYLKAEYSRVSHIFKWQVYVNGLSGPMTRGYFHGPDGSGDGNAPLIELNLPFAGNAHIGGATLTDQQAADLLAGRWSIDIQTERFPGGEIRGPVIPRK